MFDFDAIFLMADFVWSAVPVCGGLGVWPGLFFCF
jgi:hypothetical protein